MKDKSKKRHSQVTFKAYEQHQQWLLPPSLEELIPEGHIVRLVSRAIDGMKLEPLLNAYEGGGASNYHPRLLLKVLVYGYIDRLYSSRRIAKAVSENINFMWLSGMPSPAHKTISKGIIRLAIAAEQWTTEHRWLLFLVRIYPPYFGGKRPEGLPPAGELQIRG